MHTVTSFIPLAVMLALAYGLDRWDKRPAVKARLAAKLAAMSLRQKITRQFRLISIAVSVQAGYLAAFAGLRLSGHLAFSGWLAGTIVSGFYLAVYLYLLRHALAARRAYGRLGPLTYLVKIRHAFNHSWKFAQEPDVTAHNLAMLAGSRPAPGSDRSEGTAHDPQPGTVAHLAQAMPEIWPDDPR